MTPIRRQHSDHLLKQMDLDRLTAVWADLDHFARSTTLRKPQRQAELAAKYLGALIDRRHKVDGTDAEQPFSWNDHDDDAWDGMATTTE